MKKTILFFVLIAFVAFMSCGTTKLTPQEQAELKRKMESVDFTFRPQTAQPMGGRTIQLDFSFSLCVTRDSIDAYLPYFGRAYSGIPYGGGGIKFLSKDFEIVETENKKGTWNLKITTNDTPSKYVLNLKVSDSGFATLTVNDDYRQSISFYGSIE